MSQPHWPDLTLYLFKWSHLNPSSFPCHHIIPSFFQLYSKVCKLCFDSPVEICLGWGAEVSWEDWVSVRLGTTMMMMMWAGPLGTWQRWTKRLDLLLAFLRRRDGSQGTYNVDWLGTIGRQTWSERKDFFAGVRQLDTRKDKKVLEKYQWSQNVTQCWCSCEVLSHQLVPLS